MQIMPHQHVYTLLKINFHALYTSWDNFISLLLVIYTWILMSVTIYWSKWIATKTVLYCSGSKPNTALYSKPHYTYFVRVDREWNWKFTVSHLHSKPLPPKITSQIHANVAPASVLDVCVQLTLVWGLIYYDICVNYNWVVTRWQQYNTHLHTNNTQNDTKQTIHTTTQQFRKSAGSAPSWLFIPWHLPYNRGKSTETQGQCAENSFIFM
jgi:hypothetical protein